MDTDAEASDSDVELSAATTDTLTSNELREAQEIFIFMHRNFRVSRNIRAHWFFDHLNGTVAIEDSPPDNEYGSEMTVVGIIPKNGQPDELVEGEKFRVCPDTTVVYISRYYRHVFVLDLSPSTIVADDETNCCLHTKLLECLRLSMSSATKSFTKPGTRRMFIPQIYVSVVVFIPFLGFEEDLVLVHGILLTESNIDDVLQIVTDKFNELLKSLYKYSAPILRKWGQLRRRHKNRYDSACESEFDDFSEGTCVPDDYNSRDKMFTKRYNAMRPISFKKRIWEVREGSGHDDRWEGYIAPEWALIFMLRLGLIATQTLPENTQSNVIIITDAVAGTPDAQALQELLDQIRSYTVSCSFIQLQGRPRSEACFGHVASCELFHFLAMATFGAYIPNCKCSIGVDMNSRLTPSPTGEIDESVYRPMNPFHRALICWSFQNALQDNVHIMNLISEINPEFAESYKADYIRHRAYNRTYHSTLQEILYVRLRQGFTVKSVEILPELKRINIHLSLPFRPLVFVEYAINAPWSSNSKERGPIHVDLVVLSPYNEIKDLLTQDGGTVVGANPARIKLLRALRSILESIANADDLLMHIHSFNSDPAYYILPPGAADYPIFNSGEIFVNGHCKPVLEPVVKNSSSTDAFGKFLRFWATLSSMHEGVWQKWVHMHLERVILRSQVGRKVHGSLSMHHLTIDCSESKQALIEFLREKSSFCLIRDQLFVTFVQQSETEEGEGNQTDPNTKPAYFYMVRVSNEPPCMIIKMAFLGGIGSSERRRVVDQYRRQLLDMRITKDKNSVESLFLIRRPLERILVRYQTVPYDVKTIVRISVHDHGSIREMTMHNAVSKYLECRRRIWRLQPILHVSLVVHKLAEFIVAVLLHRRLQEGFNIAWIKNGIVGLARQVYVTSGPVLEQYVLFSPVTTILPPQFDAYTPSTVHLMRSGDSISSIMEHRADNYGIEREALSLIAEVWREPCAVNESHLLQAPDGYTDDTLVSTLVCLDQLLTVCDPPVRGPLPVPASPPQKKTGEILTPVSGCVTVVSRPFDLYELIIRSRRVLLHIPTFEGSSPFNPDRLSVVLSSLDRELTTSYHTSLSVSDEMFYSKILNLTIEQLQDSNERNFMKEKLNTDLRCRSRIYIKKMSSWVVSVIIMPDVQSLTTHIPCLTKGGNTYPIIAAICDEAQLAYALVTRNTIEQSLNVDVRKAIARPELYAQELPLFEVPSEWVSSVRCARVMNTNYSPLKLQDLLKQFNNSVIERTLISALFTCCRRDLDVPREDVVWILEELCRDTKLEIEAVSNCMTTFCSHVGPVKEGAEMFCCGESNLKKLFEEVLSTNFKPVPSHRSYFYYFTKKDDKKRESRAQELRESLIHDKKTHSDFDEDDDNASASTAPPLPRKKSKVSNEAPIFLYFDCTVTCHDYRENFPLSFIPSCVRQVLDLCKNKPDGLDEREVQVNMMMYVLSWPIPSEWATECLSSNSEDEAIYRDDSADFLQRLNNKGRNCVNDLMSKLNRLLELESILIDSRRQEITIDILTRISDFIALECEKGGQPGRVDQRKKPLTLVIPSESAMKRLKTRLEDLKVGYCTLRRSPGTNMYYCCQIDEDDREAFERESRQKASSKGVVKRLSKKMARSGSSSSLFPRSAFSSSLLASSERKPSSISSQGTQSVENVRKRSLSPGAVAQFELRSGAVTPINDLQPPTEIEASLGLFRKDILCDFWIILTVEKEATLQFCQRYESHHAYIFEKVWKTYREMVRTINQELLLDDMYSRRECDQLLLSEATGPEIMVDKRSSISDGDDLEVMNVTNDARYFYEPGYFKCQMQEAYWFDIHPRLRRKDDPSADVRDLLRLGLEQAAVRNVPNTYVIREEDGNVMYMQIFHKYEQVDRPKTVNRRLLPNIPVEKFENSVLLAAFGVEPAGQNIEDFINGRLRKRVDQAVLERIIDVWTKNAHAKLEPTDVKFIQKDPQSPNIVYHFSIPEDLARFLSAVSYYTQQHLMVIMYPARFKTDSGRFQPYPVVGSEVESYQPIFYLWLRPAQGGTPSIGIACIEVRIITSNGLLERLTDGVLRQDIHNLLVKSIPNVHVRSNAFREQTKTICTNSLPSDKGACAYVQAAIWQAGDVGLYDLEKTLTKVVEQALCDVITEYGVLNISILESSPHAAPPTPSSPLPPGMSQSRLGTSKASPSPASASRFMKKRDSSDASIAVSSATTSGPIMSEKRGSAFNFDERRSSFSSSDNLLSSGSTGQRPKSYHRTTQVSPKFYPHAAQWFEFVAHKAIENNEASTSSVTVWSCEFDTLQCIREALLDICSSLSEILNKKQSDCQSHSLDDQVTLCELQPATGRYEETTRKETQMTGDFGYNPEYEIEPPPEYLIIAYSKEVSSETRRYGFEITQSEAPRVLQLLEREADFFDGHLKSEFLPCLKPFIPRQRLMLGTVLRGKTTLYFYNFHANMKSMIMKQIHRTVMWQNARGVLLREINLHKMGVTFSNTTSEKANTNTYMSLVWLNPEALLRSNKPTDDIRYTKVDDLPSGFPQRLFRPYRGIDGIRRLSESKCLIKNDEQQFLQLRSNHLRELNRHRTYKRIHEELMINPDYEVQEMDLLAILTVSRRVHYVETPVLLFPKWRRKIAEVRGNIPQKQPEIKKTRSATSTTSLVRQRTATLQATAHSGSCTTHMRVRSDDDDPCQIKILYILLNDYLQYLYTLGLSLLNVKSPSSSAYKTEYNQEREEPPTACLFKAVRGGLLLVHLRFSLPYFTVAVSLWYPNEILSFRDSEVCEASILNIRELEAAKDEIVSKCHIHSFTYDFHLRMLSKYLVGKDEVLFSPGYNTSAFLIAFLKYYDCRPPNARNCVYEECPTFNLRYGIHGSLIWDYFLRAYHEKLYGWRVMKLKNSDDEPETGSFSGSENKSPDYMIVTIDGPSKTANAPSYEKLRILLKNKRRTEKVGQINLIQYLILIDAERIVPMDDDRHRSESGDSRHSEVGEFRSVVRQPLEVDTETEISLLLDLVNSGGLPTVSGTIPPRRRRYSSGSHENEGNRSGSVLKSTTSDAESQDTAGEKSDKSRERSDGHGSDSETEIKENLSIQGGGALRHRKPASSEDGDIPNETVTYVQFVSNAQRRLQKLLEDSASEYSRMLSKAVADAEYQCKRDAMWDRVSRLPKNQTSSSKLLSRFGGGQATDKENPWTILRNNAGNHGAKFSDVDTLLSLVEQIKMEDREPRLRNLLGGANCGRLCRFIYVKFGSARCRFIEDPQITNKKVLLLTAPDNVGLFMISCEGETTPIMTLLLKERFDEAANSAEAVRTRDYIQSRLDVAFDEVVQCVTAFLWWDLLQKPPGKAA